MQSLFWIINIRIWIFPLVLVYFTKSYREEIIKDILPRFYFLCDWHFQKVTIIYQGTLEIRYAKESQGKSLELCVPGMLFLPLQMGLRKS